MGQVRSAAGINAEDGMGGLTGMSCLTLPRPTLAELASHSGEDLVRRAAIGIEHLDARLFQLSDEQLDQAFLPDVGVGTWPVRVLLGHLADAEMVFVHRMRRVVAEDRPVLAVWDEQAFIDGGAYSAAVLRPGMPMPNVGGFIATIYTLRAWMSEWLSCLDPGCWARQAMHPQRGPQTLRTICEYNTWHLEHHAWYLNAKVERFLGIAPPQAAGAGCCGGHCACGGQGPAAGAPDALPADSPSAGCGKPGCCKG